MRKKMFSFKNFVMLFMAIGLLTSIGCSKQDNSNEEVDNLKKEISTLKADLSKDFQAKMDAEIGKLNAEITKLKNADKVDPKELDNKYVSKAMYETFKTDVMAKIDAAASKEALGKIETNINSLEGRVAALEGLLGLKDGESELAKKVKANEEAIKNLTEKGIDKEAFKKEFEELMKGMGVDIAALSGRITSLVLLPDYVSDKGGALPLLNFSPLKTDNCGEIVPAVTVKYVVNPSTATEDNIDTENLKFRYNDPVSMTRRNTAGVEQKAKFISLEDGILTVAATLNTEKLWDSKVNPENRIDQLMLEVPMKDGAVVSSDWAKVVSKPQELAIVKKPKAPHADTEPWKLFELKRYVHQTPGNHAIDSTVTEGVVVGDDTKDYTVVDMEYNKDLDLMKHVQSMYKDNWGVIDLDKYGLRFEFDLINHETGNPIVYKLGPNNDTDQQQFIKVSSEGVASTKVYSKDGNRAAVGRTPIIHVMLVRGEGSERCVARNGYIKLNIIEKEMPVVDPVVYNKPIEAKCGDHLVHRVLTQEMNEDFYHKVNMTKKEFHEKYTFTALPLDPADPTNVGVIKQIEDPDVTDSYNLTYTISEDDVWNNINKTAWAEGEYVYGNHKIKVKFTAPITKETVKLNITIDNYWYNNYANIIHNVAVPEAGSTDHTACTWENNINSAFKTYNKAENVDNDINTEDPHKDKFNLLMLGYRKDKETMLRYNTYTYEYKFFKTQPASPVEDITLSVTADGKELRATRGTTVETVAKIKDQDGTAGTGKGDPLEYMQDSELGKELLNAGPEAMKATVELIVKNSCGHRVNVEVKNLPKKDKFDIHFLRPVNVSGKSAKDFVDAVDFGAEGSYLDMRDVAKLSDWRNYIKNTDKYDFLPDNENFYEYYKVESIKVDVDAITVTDLKVDGQDVKTLPNTIEVKQTDNGESFTDTKGKTKVYKYGRLTYKNNGANLKQPFTMHIPVTVTYKWGKVVATVVDVVVYPSSKEARKAAK